MKYLVSILAIAMLASCGAKNTDTTKTTTNTSTNNEINQEIKSMSWTTNSGSTSTWTTSDSKVSKLDASYKNPRWKEIKVTVNYELENGKLKNVSIDSSEDYNDFKAKATKELEGKTLQEASKLYVSGASLASDGVKKAFKAQI